MSDPEKIGEIFDFLSAQTLSDSAEPAIVFGRKDSLVARAVGDLIIPGLVTTAVITGGIGKDSGDILKHGYRSEADWLWQQLATDASTRDYSLPKTLLEERATNGGENARFSLVLMAENGLAVNRLTAVAHATSARRLAQTLQFEASAIDREKTTVHVKPTAYPFDPKNPTDSNEALAEFARLIDWPTKGWLHPQDDLPENLVDFVKDVGIKSPPQPSDLAGTILRFMPPSLRVWALNKIK